MAKSSRSNEKLMRQWRACGVLALGGVLCLIALYVVLRIFRKEPSDDDHTHKAAPHGGVVLSLDEDRGHYHVEAVVEKGYRLTLYTFGEDVDHVLEVESQVLSAHVKKQGTDEAVLLELMPIPQTRDSEGKTSRFSGKLPLVLRREPLVVRGVRIEIAGRGYPLEFTLPAAGHGDKPTDQSEDEEKLYLVPGGAYTEADIKANGQQTATAKYKTLRVEHHVKSMPGERICPITRIKANPKVTWVIRTKTYEFCCPPCIDDFVSLAKTQPGLIKEPDFYVKGK